MKSSSVTTASESDIEKQIAEFIDKFESANAMLIRQCRIELRGNDAHNDAYWCMCVDNEMRYFGVAHLITEPAFELDDRASEVAGALANANPEAVRAALRRS